MKVMAVGSVTVQEDASHSVKTVTWSQFIPKTKLKVLLLKDFRKIQPQKNLKKKFWFYPKSYKFVKFSQQTLMLLYQNIELYLRILI